MLGVELAKNTLFLMGFSFVIGSLFTIFILLMLDMIRAWHEAQEHMLADQESKANQVEDKEHAEDRVA